jgi:hypothetical protein
MNSGRPRLAKSRATPKEPGRAKAVSPKATAESASIPPYQKQKPSELTTSPSTPASMDSADQHLILTVAVLPRQLALEEAAAVLVAADIPDNAANDDGAAKSRLIQVPDLCAGLHVHQSFCRSMQVETAFEK